MADGDRAQLTVSADSYIGRFLSLTSKLGIRYEGFVYHLNPQESTIVLRNVKYFGTEGRRKDGPQIFPSDQLYEFILFKGSDIEDLQVISLPTVHSTLAVPNDPAIIQSPYPNPTSRSTNLTYASSASGALKFSAICRPLLPPIFTGSPNLASTVHLSSALLSSLPVGQSATQFPRVAVQQKSVLGPAPALPYQTMPSIIRTSSASHGKVSLPSLVPGQILQPGLISPPSSNLLQAVEASDSESLSSYSKNVLEPAQQLPSPCTKKVLPTVTKSTEDFDFEALNKKFNKAEVRCLLGKSNKAELDYNEEDENRSTGDDGQNEEGDRLKNLVKKPAYDKDDFFDSFSRNQFDRKSVSGKLKSFELTKKDIETFGEFQVSRRGYDSQSQGSYRGRGHGHAGRGRGRNVWRRGT